MQEIIDKIVQQNSDLFGLNPMIEKINVGFTNTIYKINDSFIVKICTNSDNEEKFKKEIDFYNANRDNKLIPKLYYSSINKKDIPYFYEIIEKVEGVSLYNVWHTLSEEQREDLIKQLCDAMKQIHSNIGSAYNWTKEIKDQFASLYTKAKELNIFNDEEQKLLDYAFSKFEKYLESNDFVLIHNDLHFDNIFYNDGKIKLIDFERSMYAPRDFELDILYRMIRKPWKFASEETEQYTNSSDYANIMLYIEKYYPELVNIQNLYQRLAIYDMVYFLTQLVKHPELEELKNDVIFGAKIVALKDEMTFNDVEASRELVDYMNINLFFSKMVKELNLGNIVEKPLKVTGGLTHRMFKIFTDKGRYIVKLLNPNIMKRPTAMDNFNRAEKYEEILKENNIKAVYSLKFGNKKMQEIDGQYFYVYEWYDGKSLKDGEITKYHCEEMGKVLAKIHNINLINKQYSANEKNIDFKYYIDLSKEKKSPIYDLIYDKLDILNDSMNKGNDAIKHLPNYFSICHNDMDSKNVMWLNDDYKLIDLECLDYSNPYLELYELALCWSGYEKCNINFDLFKTFFKAYFDNTKLDKNVDWESIYYANNGRLEWLEFNIKRSLMIDCNTKEEQEIGINEVKETIEHIVYYDKVKNDILKNINDLIK